jgi:hypothetical protein
MAIERCAAVATATAAVVLAGVYLWRTGGEPAAPPAAERASAAPAAERAEGREPEPAKEPVAEDPPDPKFKFQIARKTDGPARTVYCEDVNVWLNRFPEQFPPGMSFVCSLPDVSETPYDLETWKKWFHDISFEVLRKLQPGQMAIFYQSDIKEFDPKTKRCVEYVHKVGIVAEAAAAVGDCKLLWHKMCTYSPLASPQPMGVGRPKYTQLVSRLPRGSDPRPRALSTLRLAQA